MKITTIGFAIAIAAMTSPLYAATILNLTADGANSTNSAASGSIAATLSDTFAYDPNSPISPMAETNFITAAGINTDTLNEQRDGWHAQPTGGTVSYTLADFTTTSVESIVAIDLYGRYRSDQTVAVQSVTQLRDNNLTITLYNGDYSTVVGTAITGFSIPEGDTPHGRALFDLGDGVTFDRFQVSSSENGWALMEIRAAAIPEPSSTALLGLGGLALILRRKK